MYWYCYTFVIKKIVLNFPLETAQNLMRTTMNPSGVKTGKEVAVAARSAARILASLSNIQRSAALEKIASDLSSASSGIVAANDADLAISKSELSPSLFSRLNLGSEKLQSAIVGVRQVAHLSDPLGLTTIKRLLDDGRCLVLIIFHFSSNRFRAHSFFYSSNFIYLYNLFICFSFVVQSIFFF